MRALSLVALGILLATGCGTPPAPSTALSSPAGSSAAKPVPLPPPAADGRLSASVAPTRYALALTIDPDKETFQGTARIDVTLERPARHVVLHGRKLEIARAEAVTSGGRVAAQATSRMAVGGKEDPEELVLAFDRELPAGKATFEIVYSAPFDTQLRGLYRVKDGGKWYAFTQFEPTDARRAFPCFDEPGWKVPFELSLTVPEGQLAVANVPEVSRAAGPAAKTTTFKFVETPPMPSYLVAFAVGALEIREGAKAPVPIRLVTTAGKSKLGELSLEATAALVERLGAYFDRPYPYPKLDIVAVPDFGAGAMENPGLVTFREELLLLDKDHASTVARRRMAEVAAHELAHQWFGDLVTMKWWNDLWLNEGFATWMEAKIVDQWQPKFGARVEALGAKGWVLGTDALGTAKAIRHQVTSTSDALEAFDGITYVKGASVLAMLEKWLGEDVFRAGVRDYIHANEWKNATAEDLLAALGKASGKDVSAVASTFLDRPGAPLVRAEVVCKVNGRPHVELSQSRFFASLGEATKAGDAPPWKLPICVRYEALGAPKTACTLLTSPKGDIELDSPRCPAWIYPNADEAGYYRFALSDKGFAALSSKAGKALDVAGRVGLVTDAWALVTAGQLAAGPFFETIQGLSGEKDRVVVEEIIGTLDAASDALVDDASRAAFRAYVSALLGPLGKKLGFSAGPKDDTDTKLLRRSVLSALGNLADDAWVLAEAEKQAAAYLADPLSTEPDTASLALRLASRKADAARFDALASLAAQAATPEQRIAALQGLGGMGDPALLRRAFELTLTDAVKAQDFRYVLQSALQRREQRAFAFAWVKERYDAIVKRLPGLVVGRLVWVAAGMCDAGAREDASRFFGERVKSIEGAERDLSQALESADLCVAVRSREAEHARAWLSGWAKKAR